MLFTLIFLITGVTNENDPPGHYGPAPVLGQELPNLPPLNLEDRIPTRQRILDQYSGSYFP